MTVEERKSFQAREYAEAIRYMDNAKDVLKKSKKDYHRYVDMKYTRMACGTAYSGLLVALDAWLTLKGVDVPKKRGANAKKKDIGFYTDNVARLDKKILAHLNTAYEILHLYGYYDGITDSRMIAAGFDDAYKIIGKIKPAA